MTESKRKLISIVSPVYNEEKVLPLFFAALQGAIAPLRERYDFEIIFTNNASVDRTPEIIGEWHAADPHVQLITLSRNFGYFPSVLSGMAHAKGDLIVIIDSDGEDPPEMIGKFVTEHEAGHWDVVYGLRGHRQEPAIMELGRKAFYRFTRRIADHDFVTDMAEFALMTRRVRDEIIKIANAFPFIRNDIGYVGFRRKGIAYARQARLAGQTHYNVFGLVIQASAFIMTASTFPMRLACYVGIPLLLLNLIVLTVFMLGGSQGHFPVLSTLNEMFLIYGVVFISAYVARIYKNGMNRPIYIIDWERTLLSTRP